MKLLNDWAHIARKWTQGAYAKLLHNRKDNDEKMKVSIDDMRAAPSDAAFGGLLRVAKALWRGLGESDFLKSFEPTYLTGVWASWHVGAAPAGVAFSGQQGVEATHASDKKCIGKGQLKAAPAVFLDQSLEIILMKAADTAEKHPVETVSHEGNAPVTGNVVVEAKLLLATKPAYLERPAVDGDRVFVINSSKTAYRKMTESRARDFEKYLAGDLGVGDESVAQTVTFDKYKKLLEKTQANRVVAKPVDTIAASNAWARKAAEANLIVGEDFYHFSCSCVDYLRGANRCPCVVAVASVVKMVDLDSLLDGATPHAKNPTGRPKTKSSWDDKTSRQPKPRDAAWYLKDIKKNKLLHYYRRVVCMMCGVGCEETAWVGYLKNATEYRGGRREYIICFPDNPDAPDEKWTAEQLANGLARADELGVRGVWGH